VRASLDFSGGANVAEVLEARDRARVNRIRSSKEGLRGSVRPNRYPTATTLRIAPGYGYIRCGRGFPNTIGWGS
jgi:hypothetical protein